MSGHSHFSSIKHKKAIEDQKRGQVFSKLARMISVAAQGGGDPNSNPKLRQALDEAKKADMPRDNIDRAIKRGIGELEGAKSLEEISYEAFLPGGVAVVIEGITDNKNRSLAEIKHILQKNGGKLAEAGSVKWLFEQKGIISLSLNNQGETKTKEELEMTVIEAGAENLEWGEDDQILEVYTKPEQLEEVRKYLEEKGIQSDNASLGWLPKEPLTLEKKEKEASERIFGELDENDAVQDIYSNLRN
jgi:YebC/PmpR family DNA-binding regulatory protein